jgi:hypothetical protein
MKKFWFPKLTEKSNNIKSNSWFDILNYKNKNYTNNNLFIAGCSKSSFYGFLNI